MTIEKKYNDPEDGENEQIFIQHEDNMDLIGSNGPKKDSSDFNKDRPLGPDDGDMLG